jgi:hypothetical protein
MIASCDSQNGACLQVRPHVTCYSALLNGRITRHMRPYRVLYDASLCAVFRFTRLVTSVLM